MLAWRKEMSKRQKHKISQEILIYSIQYIALSVSQYDFTVISQQFLLNTPSNALNNNEHLT